MKFVLAFFSFLVMTSGAFAGENDLQCRSNLKYGVCACSTEKVQAGGKGKPDLYTSSLEAIATLYKKDPHAPGPITSFSGRTLFVSNPGELEDVIERCEQIRSVLYGQGICPSGTF